MRLCDDAGFYSADWIQELLRPRVLLQQQKKSELTLCAWQKGGAFARLPRIVAESGDFLGEARAEKAKYVSYLGIAHAPSVSDKLTWLEMGT